MSVELFDANHNAMVMLNVARESGMASNVPVASNRGQDGNEGKCEPAAQIAH